MNQLLEAIKAMSQIEIWATITGLLCVYLTAKEKMSSYLFGYINAALFTIMFWEAKLYADATLQVMFILLMTYGVYMWMTGKKNRLGVRETRNITRKEIGYGIAWFGFISFLWATGLHLFTDASIPWVDAPLAMASIVAQYFLDRKVLQNWFIWIAVDIVSIPMYAYKGLYLVSLTYAVFLALAVKGYYDWRKEARLRVGEVSSTPQGSLSLVRDSSK